MALLARLAALCDTATHLARQTRAISFEIPGRHGPLWQMRVEMKSEPEGEGERLRLRAQFKLSLPRAPRFSTWVEVQTSTAALDAGAKALLPAQLAQLGIEPKNDLPVQAWAGELRGAKPGFAQMTLLQLDQRHAPPQMQPLFAERPFQLSAAVVNVIEEI